MSTFTTIKTAIRDGATMFRVLQAIPGAVIQQNVAVPVKFGWGRMKVEFLVDLTACDADAGVFGNFTAHGLRYFLVYRDKDGSLTIEINLEQSDSLGIRARIASSLQQHQAESDPAAQQRRLRREQERQEASRALAEDRAHIQEAASSSVNLPPTHSTRQRQPASPDTPSLTKEQAAAILAQLDKQRSVPGEQPTDHGSPQPPRPEMQGHLNALLLQRYAYEKVVEQVEAIEQRHGVSYAGEERFEDGTIEITLRG